MTERVADEEIIRMAFDRSPVGMIVVDASGVIVLVNPQTEKLFRYESGELIGKPVEILVPQRFAPHHPEERAAFVQSPTARPMGAGRDLFGVRKDGSEVPLEIALNPVRSGENLFVLATVADISERKQAERRLRDSEERFRRLLEGARDHAVYMIDPDGFIMSYSPGAERLFGYSEEQITGQHVTLLLDEPERAPGRVETKLAEAASRGRLEEEEWAVAQAGRRFYANTITTPVYDDGGSLTGFVRVTRDVTERVKMEERLRQSQKLEAIGTLAGGIAHDFNNILLGILGYGELVREALKHDPRAQADLDLMLTSAGRGRDLVRRILTFTRPREMLRHPVQLERPVRETLQLLRASLPTTIEIDAHIDQSTPTVMADDAQIHQIVMNLATNAAHAMSSGGVLSVRVQPFQVDAQFQKERPDLRPGLYARISISDTGTGMSDEVLARAFDPFFTTKPQGQGTGLGLPLIHGLVRGLDGAIELRSRPGEGTTADVFLPAASPSFSSEEQGGGPVPSQPERPLILFVDDESHLTQLGKRLLEGFGYAVVAYTSSLLALEDFRSRPDAFDLVITDNTMPHMTGLALIEEIHRTRPELPTMMISGIAEVMDIDQLSSRGVKALLPKPYAPQELKCAIARLLGGTQ